MKTVIAILLLFGSFAVPGFCLYQWDDTTRNRH